jgi:cell division septal protein FtsQ
MARNRMSRRERGLRIAGYLGAVLIVIGLAWTVRWLLISPRFQVARVETSRYRYVSRDSLELHLERRLGENIWRCDLGSLKDELESLPWVKRADIGRRLSGTLTVGLHEWQPRLLVPGANRLLGTLIDDGRVLPLPIELPVPDLPEYWGGSESDVMTEDTATLLLELLQALEADEFLHRDSVDYILSDERGLSIVLSGTRIRGVLGNKDFNTRLLRLQTVMSSLTEGSEVDLRFDGRIFSR